MISPTFSRELSLLRKYKHIAGIDEAGRGPIAGPVVSAAVILDPDKIGKYRSATKWWIEVRDSKILSSRKRALIARFIKYNCLDYAIGLATHQEIDEINIHHASLLSMKRALGNLKITPEMALIDGKFFIPLDLAQSTVVQKTIVDGDALVLSIAAASILAKVYRDDLMQKFDRQYREFGFASNKGYNTAFHRKSLLRAGPCPIHRMTFPAVKNIMNTRFEFLIVRKQGEVA